MANIIVRKKGHKRKAFTITRAGRKIRVPATRVKASAFRIKDRGAPGRGRKVVPPLKKGVLGGPGFFKKSASEQKRIVFGRAKRLGEKKVVGELRALQVFFKRTSPEKSKRALTLSQKVAGSFRGQQEVRYPRGFSKKK